MTELAKYAKAIVAGLVPAVFMYLVFRPDGVTSDEWQTIAMSVLASFGITWAVPNAAPLKMWVGNTTQSVNPAGAVSTTNTVVSGDASQERLYVAPPKE
jgi:hypothetical protein